MKPTAHRGRHNCPRTDLGTPPVQAVMSLSQGHSADPPRSVPRAPAERAVHTARPSHSQGPGPQGRGVAISPPRAWRLLFLPARTHLQWNGFLRRVLESWAAPPRPPDSMSRGVAAVQRVRGQRRECSRGPKTPGIHTDSLPLQIAPGTTCHGSEQMRILRLNVHLRDPKGCNGGTESQAFLRTFRRELAGPQATLCVSEKPLTQRQWPVLEHDGKEVTTPMWLCVLAQTLESPGKLLISPGPEHS